MDVIYKVKKWLLCNFVVFPILKYRKAAPETNIR